MPFFWIVPWIFVKRYADNVWCWQTESNYNLILKIPHSLLLIANIGSAIFIIKVLYSKMRRRSLTKEKILKYRRLAKSILILIPIFGLHFILFAWLPYASTINLILEITTVYAETFFNAFQGLVVSIVCCFMHREVRIECLLYVCEKLRKIQCLQSFRCMRCLDSDYIRQLRYIYSENRAGSIASRAFNNGGDPVKRPSSNVVLQNNLLNVANDLDIESSRANAKKSSLAALLIKKEDSLKNMAAEQQPKNASTTTMTTTTATATTPDQQVVEATGRRKLSATTSINSTSGSIQSQGCLMFLFSSHRNDFHQIYNNRAHLKSISTTKDEGKRSTKASNRTFIRYLSKKLEDIEESHHHHQSTSLIKKKVRLLLHTMDPNNSDAAECQTANNNKPNTETSNLLSADERISQIKENKPEKPEN